MFSKRLIVAAATVGIVLGVLYAVSVDDDREPTLSDNPPAWTKGAAITVGWEGALWQFDDDIKTAIAQVNKQIGCEHDVLVPSGSTGEITMRLLDTHACGRSDNPLPKTAIAGTWNCGEGRVEIQYRNLADPNERYPTVMHELGHALGLAHDTSGHSVMLNPAPPMVDGAPAPGFTRKDRRALRARLCK